MTAHEHEHDTPAAVRRDEDLVAPTPCPRCGHAGRLFTPNARRDPFSASPHYEPAWQCTRCGHLEFFEPARG